MALLDVSYVYLAANAAYLAAFGKSADEVVGRTASEIFGQEFFTQIEDHFIEFLKERGTEMKSECYIPTLVDELIRGGKADCKVLETTSSWFGVTYPDDKPFVVENIQKLIDTGDYPSPLD